LIGALLLAAMSLSACGGGGSSSAPVVATIVAVDPPDGAVDVEPDAAIRFLLSDSTATLAASDVVVSDGGNELPGALRQNPGTNTWLWTPQFELPRGCEIRVASRAVVLATFSVRDGGFDHEFEILGEVPSFSLSWSNGRRAVIAASGRVFEVTAVGVVERFVVVTPGARAFGDGGFICEEDVQGIHYCVRGNLDGTSSRVPTPFGVAIGDSNVDGDVVAYVPPTVAMPTDWGLWRWLRNDAAFSFAGSIVNEFVRDVPSIQANGTVSLAYAETGRVRLSRFAVGDLVGEHHELLMDGGGDAHFDCANDGRGVLAFTVLTPATATAQPHVGAHVARYQPGAGLRLFPGELHGWEIWLPPAGVHFFERIDDVVAGELGSACVVFAEGSSMNVVVPPGPTTVSTNTNYSVLRVELDDRTAPMLPYMHTFGQQPTERSFAHISPLRGELWAMSDSAQPGSSFLLRSRPDGSRAAIVYKTDPNINLVGAWCFSFDDSGRGLLALTAGTNDAPSIRVVIRN
tara:strand:+ start:8479 stop:10026 length:1548 start_codon:yes stop_codon:yes gene_type:complete